MSLKLIAKKSIKFILSSLPTKKVYANVSYLSPNKLLEGRVALVTGGTSGIGYEIAKSYMKAGATVVITGRDQSRVDAVCEKIQKETTTKNKIVGIAFDISKTEKIKENLGKVISLVGKIDILVNNAGVLGCNFVNGEPDDFDSVIDTNLKGTFFLSQQVAHYMKEHKIRGNILNVASSSSLRPATSAYTLSKWGIRGLTMGMARMLIPHNIVVNGIAPGPTSTPMLRSDANLDNIALNEIPAKRYVLPEEIANMAVVLVSDMSRMIIGDIVYMTGGAGILSYEDVDFSF